MKKFIRDYGFGLILFIMMTTATVGFWHQAYSYTRSEAQMHEQEWQAQDQRTEFWNGFWENVQSEYQQLFIQFLGMVAFASYLSHKQEHTQEAILAGVEQLLKESK